MKNGYNFRSKREALLRHAGAKTRSAAYAVATLAGLASACSSGADPGETVAESHNPVVGEVIYSPPGALPLLTEYPDDASDPDTLPQPVVRTPGMEMSASCPANLRPYIEGATRVGRVIATSGAYAQCLVEVVNTGTGEVCPFDGGSTWGPYVYQAGDPFQGESNVKITTRVIEATTNPNDFHIGCDLEIPAASNFLLYAGAALQDGTPTQENLIASNFWLAPLNTAFPNVGEKNVTNAQFFESTGVGFWHEAMHQRGWQHFPGTPAVPASGTTPAIPAVPGTFCGSVPYMIDYCMATVGVASQACTDVCPGDLRPVANYGAAGCVCSADPRIVHTMFRRVRGRVANAGELRLALDALTAGTTLGELERELRHPTIPRATGTITVDATASEANWLTSPQRAIATPVINNTGDSIYGTDLSATWRALYNDQNLYFYVDVVDLNRVQDNAPADQHQDDSIEIYIDADGSGGTTYGANDFQLAFRPGDNTVYFGDHSATSTVVPTVSSQDRPGNTGYRFEIAVPWTMLGTTPDGTIGVELHVNDDDDGGNRDAQLAWATNSPNAWENPSLFTKVALPTEIGPIINGGSVTVDGIANEPTWTRTAYNIQRTVAPVASGNGTGQWRSFWSDTHLYVFVDVTDSASTTYDGPNRWDDDSVEIYVDPDNRHGTSYEGDFQYSFRRNDPTRFWVNGTSVNLANNPQGISFSPRNVPTGYAVEVAIPWGTLGVTMTEKSLIGFDVHIQDDDNGGSRDGKRSWRSTSDTSWQNPSTFGSLRLTGTPGPDELKFFYTDTAPTIDGSVTEPLWSAWTGPPGAIDNGILSPSAVDVTAIWRGLWDYENLYLHVEVTEPGPPIANSGGAWWHDDSVELFLDPGYRHAQTYDTTYDFQFIFIPSQADSFVGNSAAWNAQDVKVASTSDGTGYTMEIQIPWRTLRRHVGVGSVLGLDVHVNDDDDGGSPDREGKLAWALSPRSGDVSVTNPRTFGRITLAP